MANWRALCEELVRHAETAQSIAVGEGLWDGDEDEGLLNRARAALAQPESEVVGPSDEDVEAAARVIYGSMRFDRIDSTSDWVPNGNSFAQDEARRCARAVLSRWSRPAPAPAGEVGELLAWLRDHACVLNPSAERKARRICDLLERRAAPVPVAVSERLPGAEDVCAKLRYCWWWNQEQDVWMYGDASHADHAVYTHWLPAHALPLPSGEVEA